MSLNTRRTNLIQQIIDINDEQTIEMLEDTLSFHLNTKNKDITDDLSKNDFEELDSLIKEPAEKDIITEEEFNKLFARWGTK
jgi:hypothetical protein